MVGWRIRIIDSMLLKQAPFRGNPGRCFYFLHCPKSNKNASDPKNSLCDRSVDLVSCYAVSPVPFSLTLLFGFMAKKRPSVRLEQFWVTVFYLVEMILSTSNCTMLYALCSMLFALWPKRGHLFVQTISGHSPLPSRDDS